MLYITTRLKRVQYIRWVMQIIVWVVFSPLCLFYWLGKASEWIIGFVSDFYFRAERKIVKKLKWDDVAKAQYARNPEKFQR